MAAGSTYTPIATYTVSGGSTAEIQFASIPQTYTDIVAISNVGGASASYYFCARINSDTGTNYSMTELLGTGSAASSTRATARAVADIVYNVHVTTGVETINVANFMNYSNSTTYKTMINRANNSADGVSATVVLWRNTAAITNLKFYIHLGNGANLYNFTSGSTITLYGIAAA
jgi:hypothetical protein